MIWKLVFPLSFFLVAGIGCIDLKSQNIDVTFEKKVKCESYSQDIEKELEDGVHVLSEIFYSPKKNSCLYTKFYYYAGDENELGAGLRSRYLIDHLTKEEIVSYSGYGSGKFEESLRLTEQDEESFNKKVESYK